MKKQSLLNYILATIIVVLLFYIRTSAEFTESKPVSELNFPGSAGCNYADISGFEPAKTIDPPNARTQTAAFQEFATRQGMTILGGVISKAALDSLLCGGAYNGIAYQFAIDASGNNGPANAISVILGGVKVQEVERAWTIVGQSNTYFKNNLWCPPSCMSY